MENNNPVGDYYFVNKEEIKRIHEREVMEGNPFISGSMAGMAGMAGMQFLTRPSGLASGSYGKIYVGPGISSKGKL